MTARRTLCALIVLLIPLLVSLLATTRVVTSAARSLPASELSTSATSPPVLVPTALPPAVATKISSGAASNHPDGAQASTIAAGSAGSAIAADSAATVPGYRLPLTGPARVLRRFQPPVSRYGAGHLGVDLASAAGQPVFSAGAGAVRFAGPVAGRGVVVVLHPDGISTEYEPVTVLVQVGAVVRMGQPIGRVTGSHHDCPASGCLHWGARRGADYLDPLSLLQPLGEVRLLPWDQGSP